MFLKRAKTKIVALFVVAFICLNATGAVCVAYCRSFVIGTLTEHCPLEKTSKHCDKTKQGGSHSISLGNVDSDCCPMTVSFFGGPIEKSLNLIEIAARPETTATRFLEPQFKTSRHRAPTKQDRGPPLDRRIDRIKHCIIRI